MAKKCFITIGKKPVEISPYIEEWAKKVVSELENINTPNECIKKIIDGTINSKVHLAQYCVNHNLNFKRISRIVYK